MSPAYVEVNVGGQVFKASAATLSKSPFFAALLGDDLFNDLRDDEGRLFIDRDAELFAEVLRLLRGYEPRNLGGRLAWRTVKAEADFYQIPMDLLKAPVEVVLPPEILSVRYLYAEPTSSETLRRDEICLYSLNDLPPDLKMHIRIVAVEVNRHQCGSKSVFVISQQVLQEAGFCERCPGTWERTERLTYHRHQGVDLVIPRHPMEVDRQETEHYTCVTFAIPPVGPIVVAGNNVVGVQSLRCL